MQDRPLRTPRYAGVEVNKLDTRLREVDRKARSGAYKKKKAALVVELEDFLSIMPGGKCLRSVGDKDLRCFLVFKDSKGKTQIHDEQCSFLGQHGVKSCGCPKRLAAGTVESLVGQVRAIFCRLGRGDTWHEVKQTGNPAYAASVRDYVKVVRKEQSKAHVTPRQAKPLFLNKLEAICGYLEREATCPCASVKEKFLYLRGTELSWPFNSLRQTGHVMLAKPWPKRLKSSQTGRVIC